MSQATAHARAPGVAAPDVTARPRARTRRLAIGPMLMVGGILAVAVGAIVFWLNGGRYVSVDDAYVQAAKEALSTDVSGIVAEVPVTDGQIVHKGDPLLRLDQRRFEIALAGARADLGATALRLVAMQRDYQRMLQDVEAKQSAVQSDQARFDRAAALVNNGGATRAEYDNA
ncbi:MAG TPA: biotin/lipoyl-binding protein, partial [Acetobacteraceae bacterium]